MTISDLVFIPSPGAGHLPPMVELAKVLLHHDQRLSITIITMNRPLQLIKYNKESQPSNPRLHFIDIPFEESAKNLSSTTAFIQHHKTHVTNIVHGIGTDSNSSRLVGFVVDMFCVAMIDVANEFGVPAYIYFTSSASTLGLMFYLQAKRDEQDFDVTGLKDSGLELPIPSFINPVPIKVLPSLAFDKEGGSKMLLDLALRFRESKGIIVNTFRELEDQGVESLLSNSYTDIPPVFPVGPLLNLKNQTNNCNTDEINQIMTWLNDQPESSVLFLCFGSNGSFNSKQVKEIAIALERSGHKFLWSLRCREEYEKPEHVLPDGFLTRTSSVGKVIGWAPQMAVLSNPSIRGFVSHCGWNSILESIWNGVPIAAWPIYAEQQLNAFQMVVELGLAAEIKIDYRRDMSTVSAEEIESGIQKVMNDGKMRKKVKEMKEKSRFTVSEDGSSYSSAQRFIDHLRSALI